MPDVGTYASCGFCHTMVDVDIDSCPTCGHQPHGARMDCRCGRPGCRDAAGHPVPFIPPSQEVRLARVVDLGFMDEIGEHLFPADPRALALCIHCGCSMDEAAGKVCGAR